VRLWQGCGSSVQHHVTQHVYKIVSQHSAVTAKKTKTLFYSKLLLPGSVTRTAPTHVLVPSLTVFDLVFVVEVVVGYNLIMHKIQLQKLIFLSTPIPQPPSLTQTPSNIRHLYHTSLSLNLISPAACRRESERP